MRKYKLTKNGKVTYHNVSPEGESKFLADNSEYLVELMSERYTVKNDDGSTTPFDVNQEDTEDAKKKRDQFKNTFPSAESLFSGDKAENENTNIKDSVLKEHSSTPDNPYQPKTDFKSEKFKNIIHGLKTSTLLDEVEATEWVGVSDDYSISDLDSLSNDIIESKEEDAVTKLYDQYGQWDFDFKQSGLGDQITVTSGSGEKKDFKVGIDNEAKAQVVADEMTAWLDKNKKWVGDALMDDFLTVHIPDEERNAMTEANDAKLQDMISKGSNDFAFNQITGVNSRGENVTATGIFSPGEWVGFNPEFKQLQDTYYQQEALEVYFKKNLPGFSSLDEEGQHNAKVNAFASEEYRGILKNVEMKYGDYSSTTGYDRSSLRKRLQAKKEGKHYKSFEDMLKYYRGRREFVYDMLTGKKRSEADFIAKAKENYISKYGMSDEDYEEYVTNRARLNNWLSEQVTSSQVVDLIKKKVATKRDEVQELFVSTERDKWLAKEAEKRFEKLKAEYKADIDAVKIIQSEIATRDEDGNLIGGIKKRQTDIAAWLKDEKNSGKAKKEYLLSDEFMSNEKNRLKEIQSQVVEISGIDYAGDSKRLSEANKKKAELIKEAKELEKKVLDGINKELQDLSKLRNDKITEFNFLAAKSKEFRNYLNAYMLKIENLEMSKEQLEAYMSEMKKNPGAVSVFFANIGHSLIDLVQNTVGFVDLILDIPEEGAQAIDEAIGGKFFSKAIAGLYTVTGVGAIFADDMFNTGEGKSLWDNWSGDIDKWQVKIKEKFSNTVTFDDAESIMEYIEWGANMMATQAGNFLAMATIPYGFLLIGAGASATKKIDLELQDKLAEGTDGIYGIERSYTSMLFNALATGAAETLSERVTFGAIKKTQMVVSAATKKQLIEGFKVTIRKNVSWSGLYNGGVEMVEEGLSETIATIAENITDYITGDRDTYIFEGVNESFVSGIVMSSVIQGVRMTPMIAQPFLSKDTNQKLGENAEKIKAFESELQRLKKESETDPKALEKAEIIRNKMVDLVDQSNKLIDKDIIRIDNMSDKEKKSLLDIGAAIFKARRKAQKIAEDPNMTQSKKDSEIAKLQQEVNDLNAQKELILDAHPDDIVNASYEANNNAIKEYQKELDDAGVVKTVVHEVGDKEMQDVATQDKLDLSSDAIIDLKRATEAEIKALQKIIKEDGASKTEKQDARKRLKEFKKASNAYGNVIQWFKSKGKNFGAIIPRFDSKNNLTHFDILVNRRRAIKEGKYATVVHEFMHRVLYNTLKGNAVLRRQMGDKVLEIIGLDTNLKDIGKSKVKWKSGKLAEFKRRVAGYAKDKKGEEIVTIMSEMMANGDVTFNTNILTKFKNMISGWIRARMNRDIQFDSTKDVENFLKDFHRSIKNQTPNKAILRMIEKGANGKIFTGVKNQQEAKRRADFSEAVVLNQRSNPDLLSDFDGHVKDRDGERKYKTNQSFKNSPDYFQAYGKIIDGKLLDGLIQQGMTDLGLPPQALKEFTRKVKEEIAMRFLKNFDITKNDSLFGWLTGVSGGMGKSIIYRAKGDVMLEYVKEGGSQKTSIDKKIGEDLTISDVLQADRDILIDQIENADLAPGRKKAAIDAVNSIKVKELLEFSNDINASIMEVITSANLTLDGLTYKGVKKLIKDGPLKKVLDIVANEFGVESERIRTNQDLNAKQRKAAQTYIFNKSVNEDGTFNKAMLNILPEGETRSGEATGVANTKLGDLYITGGRVKVSEGASKGLGQKKSQTKRSDIKLEEFLGIFGINVDGSLESGTSFDGAIRAMVSQTAQLAANQDLRINALTNGSTAQAIIAKLSDGKSEIMFSENSTEQNTIQDRWNELEDAVVNIQGKTILTEAAYRNIITNVFGDLSTKQQKQIEKKLIDTFKNWVEINEAGINFDVSLSMYTQQALYVDGSVDNETDIKKILNIDEKIGDRFLNKESVEAHRANIQETILDLVENNGYTVVEAAELIMSHLKNAVVGSGKIGKGQFIPDPNNPGKVVENPNWKGSSESNRYKFVQNVADFLNLVNSSAVVKKDGVFIKEVKTGKYEVWDGKKWTPINTTLLKENTEAALKDKDGARRQREAEDARQVVKIMLDLSWSKIGTTKSKTKGGSEFTMADFGAVIMNLGSSMNAPLRKAAPMTAYQSNIESIIEQRPEGVSIGSITQYEHSIPKAQIVKRIAEQYMDKGEMDVDKAFEGYEVFIISKQWDIAQNNASLKTSIPMEGRRALDINVAVQLADAIQRGDASLNDVNTFTSIKPIKDLDLEQRSKDFKTVVEKIVDLKFKKSPDFVKNLKKAILVQNSKMMESKGGEVEAVGMSTFDFDDTLASTKSGVRVRIPNLDGKPKPKRKVIFLAGGAGSGKGNVVSKLGLESKGFKIVNQDISLEWLKKNSGLPENMNDLTKEQRSTLGKLQHQARGIAKRKMMKYKGEGDGVVVDGTGGSAKQMQKLADEFRAKGYDVSMVFVETSLDVALERNKNRKERSLLDVIVRKNHEAVQANKDGFKTLFGETFMEVNTDNLKQNSPMPADLVSKMDNFTNSYENRRLDAEQFASEGDAILKQGGEFDFSEFNEVVEGKEGPLLQKAIERAKKFGTKDMFILTARPPQAAVAIHEFLKSQGLNIPLKNITGLGNSTGQAKADWMLQKFAEGYNDMYFVDDAMQNVEAVKDVLDQLDIKSKVVQAKKGETMFSENIDQDFNDMIERRSGIDSGKRFSEAEGKIRGQKKGGWRNYIMPASAEDFKGLMYYFLGKGKQGDADMKWFKDVLFEPFSKGVRAWNVYKQKMAEEYLTLKKTFPKVTKSLNQKVAGTNFTLDTAIRVYLWNKAGFEIPGIAETTKQKLLKHVNGNPDLIVYAETLSKITRTSEGYIKPDKFWMVQTIATDLQNVVRKVGRKQFLQQWIDNKNIVFSEANLAKIEATYGPRFREALENIIYRMENGTNRISGRFDGPVNRFLNWINGSVGATMFWNTRSAVLQTLSTVNFLNFADNNIFAASKAFANQPQFWKDFSFIFNSPMLKQRRAGLAIDVSASELTKAFAEGNNKPQAIINYLLEKGFTPTRIADSFAIAMGGASMYRNRVKKYLKEGMSKVEAEKQAFLDFQEIAEETQQSSRPDMISQEQAGVLGRIVLAWQNTPMQMTRLTVKALSDIVNGRGDMKENVAKVIYYGVAQNLIFSTLQSGLAFLMFGDEEDEVIESKQLRAVNSAFDSLLRGTGIYGSALSTLKNVIIQWDAQSKKDFGKQDWSKIANDAVSLSPPVGSKLRKIMSAVKTYEYNKGVPEQIPFRIENPMFNVSANFIEGLTNIPLARTLNKMNNLEEALNGNNETWQRVALTLGWNQWSLGIEDQTLEDARERAKQKRKEEKDKLKKQEKLKKEQEEKDRKKKEGIKTVKCSGIRSNGEPCKLTTQTKAKTWKCPHHASFKDGMDRDGDGLKEYQCTSTTSSGARCKNKTENKNKKCYAHQ